MLSTRKKYSKEFKLEAIRMYENSERSATSIEQELEITQGLLTKWIQRMQEVPKKEEAFSGNGKLSETEERIRRLEQEIYQLRQDKEILKKVLTMYSKDGK